MSQSGCSPACLSLAEVLLFDANGQQIHVAEANNPGGEYAFDSEWPQYVVDGNNLTKWLDINFSGQAILTLHLAQSVHVVQYELITSPGERLPWNWKRDPTGWRFGILRDGEFQELSTVTDFDPPQDRSTSYGRFYSIFPPPSPPFLPAPSPPPIPLPPPLPPTHSTSANGKRLPVQLYERTGCEHLRSVAGTGDILRRRG